MKHTKKLTRLLLILLALAMVLSAFAACATEDEGDSAATDGDGDGASTTPIDDGIQHGGKWDGWALDENGYIKDTLPENMDFGDEFVILADSSQQKHFYATEEDSAPLQQAIYSRNTTVDERLGITTIWKLEPCGSSKQTAFRQLCETDIQTSHEYGCVVSYNLTPYAMANKGYLYNLKDTTNLNLEAPWWPEEYLSSMLYKNQIYALVDNASYGTVTNLSCIFFNNDLLEAKKIESPYDLVEKNEWTIPKLKELIKDTYEDKNGNGSAEGGTGGDIYGLVTSTAARITGWYYGAGLRFSNINEQGELVFNNDVEDTTRRIEAIVDLFSSNDSLVNEPKSQYTMFKEELAYFYLSSVTLATNMVNNGIEIDYGVAPNPKLDSAQSRYYTHIPNTHEAWYMLTGTKDEECSSAFIEAMASEAYRQINPVFFETNLKVRYAPDEKLAKMYDLIRESITFDFVYLYKEVIGSDIDNGIRGCIQTPESKQWATVWAGIKDQVNNNFQTILDVYADRVQ
ncbi:MAG: hypothetical protein IJX19_00660 [Clostridia bacterium]|nr:hypothetical protein [Clostridia bacterium]